MCVLPFLGGAGPCCHPCLVPSCGLYLLLLSAICSAPEKPYSISGFRFEGELCPGQESGCISSLFPLRGNLLRITSVSKVCQLLERPQASWGPYPFRVPPAELQSVLPVAEGNFGEFQVQGFLPLGNELLTYLLSNNPADSGILPSPTFSASGTFSSSPVHLTRGFLPSLKKVSGRNG